MSTEAIVTGCAGFVGSALTARLIAEGRQVHGIDNFSRGTRGHLRQIIGEPSFRFVEGDIRDPEALRRLFGGTEGAHVFHLAARHFIPDCVRDPVSTFDINVTGTLRVWSAAQAARAERFLFVSTGDVYAPSVEPHTEDDATIPFNSYGLSKLTSEKMLTIEEKRQEGPRLVIARLFNVYGPGETNPHLLPDIVEQVQRGTDVLELGNLWPVRDYVFVDDVAEAFDRLIAAQDPPPVANVSYGGGWTVSEVVALLAEAIGRPLEVRSIPERCRPVERDILRANVSKLERATGWRPKTPFVEGLRRMWQAGQERSPAPSQAVLKG
jgi:UDP-glucose 4-epimerase